MSIHPNALAAKWEQRRAAVAELQDLAKQAEGREFTADEARTEARLTTAITELDEVLSEGLRTIDRGTEADEARTALEAVARPLTNGSTKMSNPNPELRAGDWLAA